MHVHRYDLSMVKVFGLLRCHVSHVDWSMLFGQFPCRDHATCHTVKEPHVTYSTVHVDVSFGRSGRLFATWRALEQPHHQVMYFSQIFERPYLSHRSSIFDVIYIPRIASTSTTTLLQDSIANSHSILNLYLNQFKLLEFFQNS